MEMLSLSTSGMASSLMLLKKLFALLAVKWENPAPKNLDISILRRAPPPSELPRLNHQSMRISSSLGADRLWFFPITVVVIASTTSSDSFIVLTVAGRDLPKSASSFLPLRDHFEPSVGVSLGYLRLLKISKSKDNTELSNESKSFQSNDCAWMDVDMSRKVLLVSIHINF
jgi:hypothetical protein